MTKLPGDRPNTFHDRDGVHRYPHPSTYEPRKSYWSASERRYAQHLDRHQELTTEPEPMEGDHEAVVTLFRHIELMKSIIAKEKLLIIAVREKLAAGGEVDAKQIRNSLRPGTVDEREM